MRNVILGLIALGSFSSFASQNLDVSKCYLEYANERLTKKVNVGIGTFGIGAAIDYLLVPEFGISKTTELLTEAVAQDEKLAPIYLDTIDGGKFGNKLEKIIKNKRTDLIEDVVSDLRQAGHLADATNEEANMLVASKIVQLTDDSTLCKDGTMNTKNVKRILMSSFND